MKAKKSLSSKGRKRLIKIGGISLMLGVLIWSVTFSKSFDRFVSNARDFIASVLPSVLVDLTNTRRYESRLAALEVSPELEEAARLKAHDMASKGYFAHFSPEGVSPWYWMKEAKYDFNYAGENLAINFNESSDVSDAWMNSPKHRDNILNGNFTEIGIAVEKGIYNGRETTFVVQMFGSPKKTAAQTSPVLQVAALSQVVKERELALDTLEDSSDPQRTQTFLSVVSEASSPNVAGEQVAESTEAEKTQTYFLSSFLSFIKNLF